MCLLLCLKGAEIPLGVVKNNKMYLLKRYYIAIGELLSTNHARYRV